MAGILNKKERIQDYTLTNNGRSQMQNGDIRFYYATFSDQGVFYHSENSISKTGSDYLGFEASSKLNDEINPEFELSDYLNYNTTVSNELYVENGKLFLSGSDDLKDAVIKITSENFLEGKLKNLKFLDSKKKLNREGIVFTDPNISDKNFLKLSKNNYPTRISGNHLNLENFNTLPFDKRLSHKLNYKKLIPQNSENKDLYDNEDTNKRFIEDINQGFTSFGYKKNINYSEIDNRDDAVLVTIKDMINNPNIAKKEYQVSNFDYNDLYLFSLYEAFENRDNPEINKLSFIDMGEIYDNVSQNFKKIYLIGKIVRTRNDYKDLDILFEFNNGYLDKGNKRNPIVLSAYYSFICMFTLVVE